MGESRFGKLSEGRGTVVAVVGFSAAEAGHGDQFRRPEFDTGKGGVSIELSLAVAGVRQQPLLQIADVGSDRDVG